MRGGLLRISSLALAVVMTGGTIVGSKGGARGSKGRSWMGSNNISKSRGKGGDKLIYEGVRAVTHKKEKVHFGEIKFRS